MDIAIHQSEERAPSQYWLTKLYSVFMAARQRQADARLAHLATQHSSVAKARAEQARAELRMYSM